MTKNLLYIIVTNVDTLNEYGLSLLEFDDLTQEEKLKIPHVHFEIDAFFQTANNPDSEELNPEDNIITPIYGD